MKRFFTKKSVACIFITILLFGFSSFGIANAATTNTSSTPKPKSDIVTKVLTFTKDLGVKTADVAAGIAASRITAPIITVIAIIEAVISFFLAISGGIFDMTLNLFVVHMSWFFTTDGVANMVWLMIRDLINISFIFILLYMAIAKIIGSWNIKSKTTFVNLIVSVIFVNFSMLVVKILIDVGNLFAVAIYNQIYSTITGTLSFTFANLLGIPNLIMDAVSLSGQINIIVIMCLQILLEISLLGFFFTSGWLLIGRFVTLFLLAVASPIGFIGQTVPFIGKYSEDWWKEFVNQLLVAPIFLFFLLISIKLLQNQAFHDIFVQTQISSLFKTRGLDISGFVIYIVIIVILSKGIKYTKDLSGKTGEIAVNVGKGILAAGAIVAGAIVAAPLFAAGGAAAGGAAAAGEAGGSAAARSAAARWSLKNIPGGLKNMGAMGAKGFDFAKANFTKENAWKFAKGGFEKEEGLAGTASRMIRPKILEAIKKNTGGWVDIKGFERAQAAEKKAQENARKEKYDNFTKEADERVKAATATRTNIDKEAREEADKKIPKTKEHEEAETELAKAKADVTQKEENHNKLGTWGTRDALLAAKNNYDKQDAKVKVFQDEYKKKIDDEFNIKKIELEKDRGYTILGKDRDNNDISELDAIIENGKNDQRIGRYKQIEYLKNIKEKAEAVGPSLINNEISVVVNGLDKKGLENIYRKLEIGDTKVVKDTTKKIIEALQDSGDIPKEKPETGSGETKKKDTDKKEK